MNVICDRSATAQAVSNNFRTAINVLRFPGLARELTTALEWRVRRAQVLYVSSASSQQAGTICAVVTPASMPDIPSRSAIISSGGVLKPVSTPSFRTNTLGAQTDWISAASDGAKVHWEFAGVIGAAQNNPVTMGTVELSITFELRGSTV
jgi:hypothetical protein